eukprot:14534375-Ditylum_brightwellii.AAC.3
MCKKCRANRVAEACIDDTDYMYVDQNDQSNETPAQIRDWLQKIAMTWERLVYGLGGKLSWKKTYWWLVWWKWEGEKATLATKQDIPTDLAIKIGKETILVAHKRKEPTDSIAQLGLLNNPAAMYNDEVTKKVQHSTQVAGRIKCSSMSAKNAYWFYQNI